MNGIYVFIFYMLKLVVNVLLYVNFMKNEEVLVFVYVNDGVLDYEIVSNYVIF